MNVASFGANAIFRKIRFESSAHGPDRIEVNYKIPQEDPLYGKDNALVTGTGPLRLTRTRRVPCRPHLRLLGTSNFPMA